MKSIHVVAKSLPEAWERAVVETWNVGASSPTEYDKPNDPNSRDVTAMIHITNPFSEPRIHRAFPAGFESLETYRSEVIYGVHDHWIDPAAGKWEYTYHQRLFAYDMTCQSCNGSGAKRVITGGPTSSYFVDCEKCNGTGRLVIDQIAECVKMLKKCGFTRRAQAITWQVWNDLNIKDPSCLQSLCFRVENGRLNMNVRIRSNCAFKASFMNMHAFTELQALVAEQVGVEVGEMIWMADSFHIYGSYFNEFQGFLDTVKNRKFEDRVWTTQDAIPMFIEGCDSLLAETDMPSDKKELVRKRKEYLERSI